MSAPRGAALSLLLVACQQVPTTPVPSLGDTPAGDDDAVDSAAPLPPGGDPSLDTPVCGDGVVAAPEACDDGADNGTTACGCAADCTLPDVVSVCDDGDPCTADACDAAGACAHVGWSGGPDGLFDLDAIRDPSTLDLAVVGRATVEWDGLEQVRIQEVRYTSWQSGRTPTDGAACVIRPVRIEAYIATPMSMAGQPRAAAGLVVAHGLGEVAAPEHARNPAADHRVVTLAYSGPGQGQSEGWGSVPDHLFDTLGHPRDSWVWEHAVAGMRALTVLETLTEVDPDRLGFTGYSGGGLVTHLVNGADDRVIMAFATSAVGHLDLAVNNPTPGWQVDLLADMTPPQDADSPAWTRWAAALDPAQHLATAHGATFVANGAQDEFFPIDATAATLTDLAARSAGTRSLTVVDWDHGWFALFNSEQPAAWISDAFSFWIRHGLIGTPGYADPPPQPGPATVTDDLCGGVPCVRVAARVPGGRWTVLDVRALASTDGLTWVEVGLERDAQDPARWSGKGDFWSTSAVGLDRAAWYVEARVRRPGQVLGETMRVTSIPQVPAGFHPKILPIDGPLPL